ECPVQKIEGGRSKVMRAAFNGDAAGRRRAKKRREDRLEDEGPASGRSHSETVFTGPDRSRIECQRGRPEACAFHFGAADFACGKNRSQMLAQQSRVLPARANVFDSKRYPRRQRKTQGGPQNLTAPFAEGSIDADHRIS